jgi:hypothetical protein
MPDNHLYFTIENIEVVTCRTVDHQEQQNVPVLVTYNSTNPLAVEADLRGQAIFDK